MHPNPKFAWRDRDQIHAFVRDLGFGAFFVSTPGGPRVAHAPVVWLDDDTLGLHIARGNAVAKHLPGETVLFTALGPDAYVSPDWYAAGPNEVPTWNYLSAELQGRLVEMDRAGLIAQIDQLSREQERRLAPKPEWTRAKADPAIIDQMLTAIIGFRFEITAWGGTRKFGQNKPGAARLAAAAALDAQGQHVVAQHMRQA